MVRQCSTEALRVGNLECRPIIPPGPCLSQQLLVASLVSSTASVACAAEPRDTGVSMAPGGTSLCRPVLPNERRPVPARL